jgi:hypothetical protein
MITPQQRYLQTEKGKAAARRAKHTYYMKTRPVKNINWDEWPSRQFTQILINLRYGMTGIEKKLKQLDEAQAKGYLNGTGYDYDAIKNLLQARLTLLAEALEHWATLGKSL